MRFSRVLFSSALAAQIVFSKAIANQISFSDPVRFSQAIESRDVRSILPTTLSSAELEQISSDILERATFSARVASAEYLQEIDDVTRAYVNGEIDLASARLQLKEKLQEIGYHPDAEEAGSITDFSSDQRINLVLRINAEMASGYGNWIHDQNPVVLDQWPAQELVRVAARKMPRNWIQRWGQAGGSIFSGRMVALRNDRIWTAISRFGNPYPPFDFNSGMGTRLVDRDTAMKFGLIDRDTIIPPETREFNQDLKFTPEVRAEALRQVLIDEGYSFEGEVLTL